MPRHPNDPLENLQREVQRLFYGLVYHRYPASHFAEPAWSPPADVLVSEQHAHVMLELAGVRRENVRVWLRGNILEVVGRREPPQELGNAHYHRAEIFFGEFGRTIELPWEADENSVEANSRDGILEIRLQAASRPQRAPITVALHSE
jgi:HSP20 family protein